MSPDIIGKLSRWGLQIKKMHIHFGSGYYWHGICLIKMPFRKREVLARPRSGPFFSIGFLPEAGLMGAAVRHLPR